MAKVSSTQIAEMNLDEALNIASLIDHRNAVMLWSEPGLGKSEGITSTFEGMKYRIVEVLAGCLEPTDLTGIPTKRISFMGIHI